MEIEIVSKQENVLLKRTDVRFKILHPKEKTPARQAIRDKIAGVVGSPAAGVIIGYMRSSYGLASTQGFAKCYASADVAKKTEPKFLLKRHGLVEKKEAKKEEGPKAPPPPPPARKEKEAAAAPAAKKDEKPASAPAPKKDEKKEEKPYVPKGAEKK